MYSVARKNGSIQQCSLPKAARPVSTISRRPLTPASRTDSHSWHDAPSVVQKSRISGRRAGLDFSNVMERGQSRDTVGYRLGSIGGDHCRRDALRSDVVESNHGFDVKFRARASAV
jgi:hypothetical protein